MQPVKQEIKADERTQCGCGVEINVIVRTIYGSIHPSKTRTAQHTPGPWEVFAGTIIRDAKGRHLTITPESSQMCGNPSDCFDETRANARLIAAAPDMLEALCGALEYFESPPFIALHGDMPAKLTRTTIAKAEWRA